MDKRHIPQTTWHHNAPIHVNIRGPAPRHMCAEPHLDIRGRLIFVHQVVNTPDVLPYSVDESKTLHLRWDNPRESRTCDEIFLKMIAMIGQSYRDVKDLSAPG